MEIIDSHTHWGPSVTMGIEVTTEELLRQAEQCNVSRIVIFPFPSMALADEKINERLLEEAGRVNPVRNSSGVLNPALRGGPPYGAEPGIIVKSNPVAAAGPEGLPPGHEPFRGGAWPGGSRRGIISNGVKKFIPYYYIPETMKPIPDGRDFTVASGIGCGASRIVHRTTRRWKILNWENLLKPQKGLIFLSSLRRNSVSRRLL